MVQIPNEIIHKLEEDMNWHEAEYQNSMNAGFQKYATSEFFKVKGMIEVLAALGYTVERDKNNHCVIVPD